MLDMFDCFSFYKNTSIWKIFQVGQCAAPRNDLPACCRVSSQGQVSPASFTSSAITPDKRAKFSALFCKSSAFWKAAPPSVRIKHDKRQVAPEWDVSLSPKTTQ
jgi:hypothetical protein